MFGLILFTRPHFCVPVMIYTVAVGLFVDYQITRTYVRLIAGDVCCFVLCTICNVDKQVLI